MTIEARTSADEKVGETCQKHFQLTSPIVLTFNQNSKPDLYHPAEVNVMFDLDGDGLKEQTGWIHESSGFLVMDRNLNGVIDSGHEMFGEYTAGKSFTNGYLALKDLDKANLSYIDSKNPNFQKLRIWFDYNLDGKSQPSELKTLSQMNVTRIDTNYKNLDLNSKVFDNQVRYSSRFYGPKVCGENGCNSYDVFFSTIKEIAKNK
jgi:hypothetical protein